MTVDNDPNLTSGGSSIDTPQTGQGGASASPKEVAGAAKEQTSAVAQSAAAAGKEVAHEASAQVSQVAGTAKEQLSTVVSQAKSELKSQADARGQQAASGLMALSDQLTALKEGRTNDAGHIGTLVGDAQQRVQSYALTLQDRGPQAVLDDVASFARRRPIVFLFGAAVAGFAAGRLVRATAATHSESSNSSSTYGSSDGISNYAVPSTTQYAVSGAPGYSPTDALDPTTADVLSGTLPAPKVGTPTIDPFRGPEA